MKHGTDSTLVLFSASRQRACSYLPDREEQMVLTDLRSADDPARLHETLNQAGFRRSHQVAYRPACIGCDACVPVRIPVVDYRASRSHRRILRRNRDLEVHVAAPDATPEHHALFRRYIEARHQGGGMSMMDDDDFREMVSDTPVDTRLVEARTAEGLLVAVSLTDWMENGLSGVYKFFDPQLARRSLGTWLILWHIAHARETGRDHVYLGYWIAASQTMSYKGNFRPLQSLTDNGWVDLPPRSATMDNASRQTAR